MAILGPILSVWLNPNLSLQGVGLGGVAPGFRDGIRKPGPVLSVFILPLKIPPGAPTPPKRQHRGNTGRATTGPDGPKGRQQTEPQRTPDANNGTDRTERPTTKQTEVMLSTKDLEAASWEISLQT